MVTAEPFGRLVRRYRRGAELTQEALAERAGLSVRAVRDIEAGSKHRPRPDTIGLLIEALEIPEEEQADFLAAAGRLASAVAVQDAPAPRATQLLTILIADMRGYTAYTTKQGDEAAAGLAQRFAQITAEVVEQHGGTVVELRGDEALISFSSARQALRAALALQERYRPDERRGGLPLGVGIGLDAGEVVPVQEGYRGRALNLAARLCSLAAGGDVLVSDGVLHLAGTMEGIACVDRGPVALKGLPDPVRVIQIALEGELSHELPPLQPILVTHPTNLPDEPTTLIGRERETAQIAGLLQKPHIRLLTLTGAGGTGKTRLALRAGSTLLHTFRDGVFLVSLAPLADPALVPATIAEVLAVREETGKPLLDSLVEHLRGKHLLLVLDNYEHLLAASPVVSSLLDACRELHVLVTSRSPLHVSREHEYPVPPLSVPDPTHLPNLESLLQFEAVALFIQRAQAVKPDFQLNEQNASAVAEICARLDGLPLAIELAAARIKLLPPRALLLRLERRLGVLTGGSRDLSARQQTLRGAIEWSYRLLDQSEQELFAQLSVFSGGCTLEAAETVCNPREPAVDVFDGLASLVDKSLLRQDEMVEGEPRFVMLETIREYAAERLQAGGHLDDVHGRHALFFLTLAEQAEPELRGAHSASWVDRLERDIANVRAALHWAAESDPELGLGLAGAMWRFWMMCGPIGEGRRWLQQMLARSAQADRRRRAKGLKAAGILASWQRDYERAQELLESGLALFRELGDAGEVASTLNNLGILADSRADFGTARALYEESLALYRQLGDAWGNATTLNNLATMASAQGRFEEARDRYQECLQLFRTLRNPWAEAATLSNLGSVMSDQGDYPGATRHFTEALAVSRELGDKQLIAECLENLAMVSGAMGRVDRAARLFGAADALRTAIELPIEAGQRDRYERFLAAARSQLDIAAWQEAWDDGATMAAERAVEYALAAGSALAAGPGFSS